MPRYMIEVPQSSDKRACLDAVHVFLKTGSHHLTHCDWGCLDGEHKAGITVETDNCDDALRIVPSAFRHDTKVTQLDRFSFEQVERMKEKHSG